MDPQGYRSGWYLGALCIFYNTKRFSEEIAPMNIHPPSSWDDLLNPAYKSNVVIHCTSDNRQFANIIALFLTKIGMQTTINTVKSDRLDVLGENSPWDIFVTSWGNSTLDPSGILEPKFSTNGQGNYSGYSNEEVDDLLSRAESTLDYSMRLNYYKKVQEIIFDDATW